MRPDADARRRLRIALVVEKYTRSGSGVEGVVRELARGLVERGDEVHVVARSAEADADATVPGVRLHPVRVPTKLQPLRLLEFSRAARQCVERNDFDVVHGFARVYGQDLFHSGLGCHAAYLNAVHGAAGRTLRRLSPRHAVQLQLEARIARDPGIAIQCVSETVAEDFRRHYAVSEERLRFVPNGVDLQRFGPATAAGGRDALRAEHAAGTDAVWLFLGSGFRRKGLDVAIGALARSRLAHSVLWVVGHDRPRRWQRLAQRLGVADRVCFLGERRDVARLIAASDGLVLPTRYDPAPLVVLEAAAAGRPVVTSRACGHAEPFVDEALVVADANDVDAFAAALDGLADGRRRSRIARAARREAESRDWASVVDAMREEYLRIVHGRRMRGASR